MLVLCEGLLLWQGASLTSMGGGFSCGRGFAFYLSCVRGHGPHGILDKPRRNIVFGATVVAVPTTREVKAAQTRRSSSSGSLSTGVGPARDPWINWVRVACREGCSQSVNMLSKKSSLSQATSRVCQRPRCSLRTRQGSQKLRVTDPRDVQRPEAKLH
jgi:hypothetical protein